MASTRDYLEFLNQKIDIAPVNSEEEYQASSLIESLMQAHGLETRLQEFEARSLGELPYRVCGILLFLGVFLSGILGTPAAIFGELLVLACIVLLGVRYLGIANPIGNLGGAINSQNVIGIHRATGPLVTKGSRPIVIVAHYDTPRENLLYAPPFDRWQRLLRKFAPQCVCVAALFAFIQTFGFVPAGFRHLLWVLAIVAALPQLLVGIAAIQERFAPCTEGSNDNKSGVAAMLGVMSMVHPGDDEATGFGAQREARDRQRAERLAREAAEEQAHEAALAEQEAELAALAEAENAEELSEQDADEAGAEVLSFAGADIEDLDDVEPQTEDVVEGNQISESEELSDSDVEEEMYAEEPEPEPEIVVRREVQVERIEGVRHGKEMLEELHILPEDCEIVYVEPEIRVHTYEEVLEPAAEGAYGFDEYDEYEEYGDGEYWEEAPRESVLDRVRDVFFSVRQTVSERLAARRERKEAEAAQAAAEESLSEPIAEEAGNLIPFEGGAEANEPIGDYDEPDELDAGATEVVSEEDVLLGEVHAVVDGADAPQTADGTIPFVPLGELRDGREVDEQGDAKDATGLDTLSVNAATSSESSPAAAPLPPDDPTWGQSSFHPEVSDVARRAVLFDLPDPLGSTGANDPLSGSLDTPVDTDATTVVNVSNQQETEQTPQAVVPEAAPRGLRRLISRKSKDGEQESLGEWLGVGDDYDAKREGGAIGSWDNFESSDERTRGDGEWKGGATQRSGLRVVEDDDVRVQEDLREAILGMGEDELIAHDIWFVALGGSHADQAGMRAFLNDNRRSIRGCFLINLSCVGSGQLSLLTHEGLAGTRRADRRIVRLLDQIADDLHVDLPHVRHDWEETDATPAMRSSLRCATVCGLTQDDALALSKVAGDEPDLVDPAQTALASDLVAEMIRRS